MSKKKRVIGLASSPLESLLGPSLAPASAPAPRGNTVPAPQPEPQPEPVEPAPEVQAESTLEVHAPPRQPERPLRSVPTPKPARKDRCRATFQMDRELMERCRDTVVALSGPPVRLTLVDFVEAAVRAEIARLEEAHNEGEPFPTRDGELRIGRPIGS